MRKALMLLLITLFITGCSQSLKGVEIDDDLDMQVFTFDEDDFKDKYADNTGKAAPVGLEFNELTISVWDASAEQIEGVLKTSYDLLGDEELKIMYKSFKEDRDELTPGGRKGWRKVESGERLLVDYGILENEKYMVGVRLHIEPE